MTYNVHWTLEAEYTFNQNLAYLDKEWTRKVLNDFLDRVDLVLLKMSSNPLLYPLYQPGNDVRKCPINKSIVLYYRVVDNSTIDLITFWNNYQDPKNLML